MVIYIRRDEENMVVNEFEYYLYQDEARGVNGYAMKRKRKGNKQEKVKRGFCLPIC